MIGYSPGRAYCLGDGGFNPYRSNHEDLVSSTSLSFLLVEELSSGKPERREIASTKKIIHKLFIKNITFSKYYLFKVLPKKNFLFFYAQIFWLKIFG
jgi:hypothetical protein